MSAWSVLYEFGAGGGVEPYAIKEPSGEESPMAGPDGVEMMLRAFTITPPCFE
jgi:hypothetical protein